MNEACKDGAVLMKRKEFEGIARRGMREALVAVMPARHVDEVVDLAMHAATEADRKLSEICAQAGFRGGEVATLAPALSLLGQIVEGRLSVLRQMAAEAGIECCVVEIEIGPRSAEG